MRVAPSLDGLYVPVRAPRYADFRAELLSFPAGKHDDQVDALGLVGQVLDKMHAGALPKPPEKLRCANEMTMDEAWDLARPKRPGVCAHLTAQSSYEQVTRSPILLPIIAFLGSKFRLQRAGRRRALQPPVRRRHQKLGRRPPQN